MCRNHPGLHVPARSPAPPVQRPTRASAARAAPPRRRALRPVYRPPFGPAPAIDAAIG